MRIRIRFSLWLLCAASTLAANAAAPAMRPYTIELPQHVLRFSLPEEMAREMGPLMVETRFDPFDPSYLRNRFRDIAGTMYDFKGPFWVGAIGSLKFHFMVQMRDPEYQGVITSADGLERYVHWWIIKVDKDAATRTFSRTTLNGMPAVRREWDGFRSSAEPNPKHLENLLAPSRREDVFGSRIQHSGVGQWSRRKVETEGGSDARSHQVDCRA